jgi:cytochrome c oxidase subunit 4
MSHDHAPSQAHAHAAHDVTKDVRKYLIVFGSLLIGTVVTVGMYYVYLPSVALTVAIALFIASVKAFLVAGYFMHLISERKMIYGVMASTVFFFIALMWLTIWSMNDFPKDTSFWGHAKPARLAPGGGH